MVLTTIEDDQAGCSNEFIDFLEKLPCAVYIVKNDVDLTFLYGNACFYTLFGCAADDINHKYGNRLGALITPDSLNELGTLLHGQTEQSKKTFAMKQQIKKNGIESCIYTEICVYSSNGNTNLFCVAFDITESENKIKNLDDYGKTVGFAIEQGNFDTFEYDLTTHFTRFFKTSSLLAQVLPKVESQYSDIVKTIAATGGVHPHSMAEFKKTFASISPDKPRATCDIQMINLDRKEIWVRLTLVLKPKVETQSQYAIGFLENITAQKEAYINYLNETQFYQAMMAEKEAYGQLDATEDRVTQVGGIWNIYNEIIHKESCHSIIKNYTSKLVHVDDRERYLEVMECANLIESLDNGIDRLGCEFRRIVEQNKMVWMELNIHLFKNPLTAHTLGLFYIKDIDEKKRCEIALLHSTDRRHVLELSHEKLNVNETTVGELGGKERGQDCDSLFDTFLSSQGDLAYLVDPNNLNFICGNKAFYQRIGRCKEECHGKKCYELMHKRKSPCPFCSKANWSTDKFYLWKNHNYVLEQEFLVKNKLVPWNGKEFLLAISVDISNNKSIVDSIENGATECHCILSGVQAMAAARNLNAVMDSALETIGHFFGADSVHFWEHKDNRDDYRCTYAWTKTGERIVLKKGELAEVNAWISNAKLEKAIVLESPEAMLCYSYGLYQIMKTKNIRNQKWLQLKNCKTVEGVIGIDNISRNFQSVAFLEAFTGFIGDEIKKRRLVKSLYNAYQRDELTDLLSRNSYEQYLSEYRSDMISGVGVMIANVDRLKDINNSKGFHIGNHYLREFAGMLKEVFSQNEKFRLNGDEFLVIATNTEKIDFENAVCEVERRIKANGTFSVSIGYDWDDIEKDLTAMIEQSTQTMKINKLLHHDSDNNAVDLDRRKMLSELVTAIENNEFEVFLQPKIEFEHNSLAGAEALIRYNHKTKGYIPPVYFIEKLENVNLIRYVDLFVFEEVCKVLERWKNCGLSLPIISVNFSRITLLERNILSSVEDIMARYNVSKKNIEIEITESMSTMGKNTLCQATNTLRNAGFLISLDDFGTKYTNITILSEIDFDVLKLDKSLVGSLRNKYSNQVILRNVINMCNELGISVIAEGIETEDQEIIVRKLGCKQGQGYLYGKPMTVKEFEKKYNLQS